ncbi:RidA family protein [Glacieibacterium frigidum]|uniref:RidA family protein n=1 Tax=Glacieibacterium frigidum TaxID=2593303 RepID=A0A552UG47_9SPHN|nr:RidA family protein [Glacieibacterium frigidum]TRW17184.1 RidA family protein [Glacieibacterium frigidum]
MSARYLAALALLTATAATARDPANVIMPTDPRALAQQQQYGYAGAVIAGDTIYLSGVIAGPAATPADMEPAYERAFAQIPAILKRSGASWDDVVDMTTYHTDLAGQAAAISAVKNRYVKAPFPAWTAIQISKLFEPSGITEIKVVARKPAKR